MKNGQGLLPGFVADSTGSNFDRNLNKYVETFKDIVADTKYKSSVGISEDINDENIPESIKPRPNHSFQF